MASPKTKNGCLPGKVRSRETKRCRNPRKPGPKLGSKKTGSPKSPKSMKVAAGKALYKKTKANAPGLKSWQAAVKKAEKELGMTRPVPMRKTDKFYKVARKHYDAIIG